MTDNRNLRVRLEWLIGDDGKLDVIAISDAINALKEQEAKLVLDIADSVDGIEVGRCPRCGKAIVNKMSDPTRFCKFCGQAVKWE